VRVGLGAGGRDRSGLPVKVGPLIGGMVRSDVKGWIGQM
jgi:hypothetical protein